MEMRILKAGNLMGSPDVKAMQQTAGVGSEQAHRLFEHLFRIKLALGQDGQATSVLLLNPACPDRFPAVVDFSFIGPDPSSYSSDAPIQRAMDCLATCGLQPEDIRSVLVTHRHPDHFDRRLPARVQEAEVFAPILSNVEFDRAFGGHIQVIDTPGHGIDHHSFLFDIKTLDLSVCLAGDLIMSQAHFYNLDHPLSFADHEQGNKSVQRVLSALTSRKTSYQLIVPGHDHPFFANPFL